jgi:expansin (peptidoglycan-binding protein)
MAAPTVVSCSYAVTAYDTGYGAALPSGNLGEQACGACLEVRYLSKAVTVIAVDKCTSGSCAGPDDDLDLYTAAYQDLFSGPVQPIPVQWRFVECPAALWTSNSGAFSYEIYSGDSQYYLQFHFINQNFPLVHVELHDSTTSTYTSLTQLAGTWYGNFSPGLTFPVTVRVTDGPGDPLVFTIDSMPSADTFYPVGNQFPSCP